MLKKTYTNNKSVDLEEFSRRLGYKFFDQNLLIIALTHSSYLNENRSRKVLSNERLEFLGDAVLDLVIGEFFYHKFKEYKEGDLSKLRAQVVNENSLYGIAKKLSLGNYMKFGKGELKNRGKLKSSILSDCLEAIIGAIYVDSDISNAKKVILNLFQDDLNKLESKKDIIDYKSMLQEYIQRHKNWNVKYIIYDEKGPDNNKVFYSKIILNGNIFSYGEGTSKKKSQQNAAYKALKKFGELDE